MQEKTSEQATKPSKYRVLHDQTYGTYEEADGERRSRLEASPELRVRVRRLRSGYRLVVRERISEAR